MVSPHQCQSRPCPICWRAWWCTMRHAVAFVPSQLGQPCRENRGSRTVARPGGSSLAEFCPWSLATPAQGPPKLSSVDNMKLLPILTSASSSKPELAQSPNEPGQGDVSQPRAKPGIKTNMVAHEVRVKVTGLHSGNNAWQRELFTEETTSVLVHETGGVIQLSAPVARGELLLLTNLESKREVVAQVKRKRLYKPIISYVELEFAEPAPRFWGMDFSASSSLLPKDPKDAEAAALVMAAEASADESGDTPPPPSPEQVQGLKQEVRALQEQAPGGAATPKSSPTVLDRAFVQLTAADEAQLPTPSLDFTDFTAAKGWRLRRARGKFTPGAALRLSLLTAALMVTAAGAAWYKHWTPWKAPKNPSLSGSAIADNATTSVPLANGEVAKERPEFRNTSAANTPATSPGVSSRPAVLPPQPFASSGSVTPPAVRPTSPSATLAAKRVAVRPAAPANSVPVVASPLETSIVPPKLLKSVRAVASLDDLRDFETGNVVIDAVVDTDGEVHFLSVLSGPPSLRGAAVESVKQYRYQPATRNGQPVPAHVTITVRFRFES